jgi:hypothetical protein
MDSFRAVLGNPLGKLDEDKPAQRLEGSLYPLTAA